MAAILGTITNAEARAEHRDQWFRGKHRGTSESSYAWPYVGRGVDDDFVLVRVPIEQVNAIATSEERAEEYVEILRRQDMGPSWGLVKTLSRRNEALPPVYLVDGNHRAIAAYVLGHKSIQVLMPLSSFEIYEQRLRAVA